MLYLFWSFQSLQKAPENGIDSWAVSERPLESLSFLLVTEGGNCEMAQMEFRDLVVCI